jgi:uncharacterized protein DUF4386
MNDASSGSSERDQRSTVARWGLVAGCLSLLLLIGSTQPGPPDAANRLALFATRTRLVALTATIMLSWAVFSIPFVVSLGQLLRPLNPGLALSASVSSAIGIALLVFAQFTYIGAMLSIVATGHPVTAADAIYQAAIWGNLSFFLTDPGLMTWGLGQFLFGWLAWRSGILPKWLSVVGLVSGGAGLLTLAVYQTSALAVIQIVTFTVWALATAIVLFRSASPSRRLGDDVRAARPLRGE